MRGIAVFLAIAAAVLRGQAIPPSSIQSTAGDAGAPNLYASAGTRTDGEAPGTRVVPIQLSNMGIGPAVEARIDSIAAKVVTGDGRVTLVTRLPLELGTIQPSSTAISNTIFNWPASATRVRIDIHYSSSGGKYQNDTSLSLLR